MAEMTRILLCSVQFGRYVKLTPQGKIYKVQATLGFGRDVVLLDSKGKETLKPYLASVYLMARENEPKNQTDFSYRIE